MSANAVQMRASSGARARRRRSPPARGKAPGTGGPWRRPGATGTRSRERVAETAHRIASIRSPAAGSGGWRQPAPAAPRHSRPPLPLLPSGPDGVHDLAMRGDRCGPPSTVRVIAKAREDITGRDADLKSDSTALLARLDASGTPPRMPRSARMRRPPWDCDYSGATRPTSVAAPDGAHWSIAHSTRLPYPLRPPERCPSGLRSTPGKCVYVNSVPRVRIPPSPPLYQ